jgi:NAD(P)-dependent dehydrogenase (short-subunit alcohol dehydrogenase family)
VEKHPRAGNRKTAEKARTALVTGANRGLGLEFTRQLLQRGYHVYAACRDPLSANDLRLASTPASAELTVISMDIGHPSSISEAVEVVAQATKRLDLLINNAGINAPTEGSKHECATMGELQASAVLELFSVNAVGPLLLVQETVSMLTHAPAPLILNLTSIRGCIRMVETGGKYGYKASKAALNILTRILSVDLRSRNIIVAGLDPGWVRTRMGGVDGELSPEESVRGMLGIMDCLTIADTGRLFSWNGGELAW